MKKKGFTLVELLVVIAIIALLMGILMPALAKVRAIAGRLVCGTNLSGIGKAILIYANENEEEYPVAGRIRATRWSTSGYISDWLAPARADAFSDGTATVSSSFYLLVKYGDVTPKQFVCGGDGAKEFKISDYPVAAGLELADIWDFGPEPGLHCSYSYHMPYYVGSVSGFPITESSNPSSPLCADRNPYLDKNATSYLTDTTLGDPYWDTTEGYRDLDRKGNSAAHQREKQNVLYNDFHVTAESYPNVGIENDNIWKYWPSATTPIPRIRQLESPPTEPIGNGESWPMAYEDAYLVNERND